MINISEKSPSNPPSRGGERGFSSYAGCAPVMKARFSDSRWIIVGFSFVMAALAYGSTYYSFSVFFVALLNEFGWSRSLTAGAYSLFLLFLGFAGPFVGSMVDRFGPRRVFLSGSIVLGAGLALCSLIHRWWEFYISYSIVTAIGAGCIGFVPNATLIQQRFREKRGWAMGVLSSGIGFGIFTCVPSIQHLINRMGWRMTYRVIAVFIPFVTFLMVAAFLKDSPGTDPPSHGNGKGASPVKKDSLIVNQEWASRIWTIRQAINTRPFRLLWASLFLSNFTIHSILTHQVAFFIDRGLSALVASYAAGTIGVVSIAGKIAWGGLSDRIGREATYLAGTACSVSGIALLITFNAFPNTTISYLFAISYGLGYAAVTALTPLIAADIFEGPAYGSILGALFIAISLGGACGVWFTGFVYDQAKSYIPAFIILIVFTLCALLSIWMAAPRKIRRVPGKRA